MNKITLKKQLGMVLTFLVLLWSLAACQTNQGIPSEVDILATTYIDPVTPTESAVPKLNSTVIPTELATSVSLLPDVTPFATQTKISTEAMVPTTVPTPLPWGGRLAFASQRHDTNADGVIDDHDGIHIYSFEIETNQLTQLTYGNYRDICPSWSPDGERLVFISNRTGNFELFTVNAEGSDLRQLTNSPEDKTMPSWSPDGFNIAYILVKDLDAGEQERSLWIASSDGSMVQELPTGLGNIYNPVWSPDGRYLLFKRRDRVDRSGNIKRVHNTYFWDTQTSSFEQLVLEGSAFYNIYLRDPKWLPRDGYFLSFGVEMRLSDTPSRIVKVYEVVWKDGQPTLSETLLINNVYNPYIWGPNGDWMITIDSSNMDSETIVWRSPIDYSNQPSVIAIDDLPSQELIINIDNIYQNSELAWTP